MLKPGSRTAESVRPAGTTSTNRVNPSQSNLIRKRPLIDLLRSPGLSWMRGNDGMNPLQNRQSGESEYICHANVNLISGIDTLSAIRARFLRLNHNLRDLLNLLNAGARADGDVMGIRRTHRSEGLTPEGLHRQGTEPEL